MECTFHLLALLGGTRQSPVLFHGASLLVISLVTTCQHWWAGNCLQSNYMELDLSLVALCTTGQLSWVDTKQSSQLPERCAELRIAPLSALTNLCQTCSVELACYSVALSPTVSTFGRVPKAREKERSLKGTRHTSAYREMAPVLRCKNGSVWA